MLLRQKPCLPKWYTRDRIQRMISKTGRTKWEKQVTEGSGQAGFVQLWNADDRQWWGHRTNSGKLFSLRLHTMWSTAKTIIKRSKYYYKYYYWQYYYYYYYQYYYYQYIYYYQYYFLL